jgi:hypothetical protein
MFSLLFFLLCVSDQMLTDWKLKGIIKSYFLILYLFFEDSIAPYVPSEISTTLFDCWMRAALSDLIHGTSYWRTLSRICWKSAIYVISDDITAIFLQS